MVLHSKYGNVTYEEEVNRLKELEKRKLDKEDRNNKIYELYTRSQFSYAKLSVMFDLNKSHIKKIIRRIAKSICPNHNPDPASSG